MSPIQDCYEMTRKMISILRERDAEDRDNIIEMVEDFLHRREQLFDKIQPPFSEQEQTLGDHLVLLGKQLDILLMNLKQDIQKDMNGLSKKKTSVNRYTNPYDSMQTDGFFYDKRK